MPLPTPALDDRTFQDIVDEAKRLIPRYCPEWTNHNVSDPGVALIELFAWMSEMVLYRVNQVPERLYTHFLNLVGIEPFPPSVARADLTFWLSAVLDHAAVVPAGTEVMTAGSAPGDSVVFSTTSELVIAPPVITGAVTLVPSYAGRATSPGGRAASSGGRAASASERVETATVDQIASGGRAGSASERVETATVDQIASGGRAGSASERVETATVDQIASGGRAASASERVETATVDQIADVWDDLRYGASGAQAFASPELTPGDALAIGFRDSLAGMVVRLNVQAEAEGIGVDPTRPPLAWEVWNGEGWIPVLVHTDTTGGLNRAGQIVLLVPTEHQPHVIGNQSAHWLRVRLLQPLPGQPTYQASPRLRGLTAEALGGTVSAEHAERLPGEVLGRSNGSPGQSFAVSRTPVLPRQDGEHVQVVDGDETTVWTEVEDFSTSGPADRVYVWDSGSGIVRFGPRVRYPDGSVRQHGAIPRDGARIEVSGYRHGGGARGNVGARTLTLLRSTVPFVNQVTNLERASGGVDAETVAEAKTRGPLTLRTGQRAVTAGDFERLTLETSTEVARARCQQARTGNAQVQLLVVPQVRSDPATHRLDDYAISPTLMQQITERLDAHRIVGTSVEVSTPYYQGVSVVALLNPEPGRPPTLVRQRAVEALARFLNPLVGGSDGNGWPFDADVNTAVVTQLLEGVEGVDRVEEVLLFEYDLRTGRRLGSAKDVIKLDRQSLFLAAAPQVVVR